LRQHQRDASHRQPNGTGPIQGKELRNADVRAASMLRPFAAIATA
jgi:hypothetical protein